MQLLHLFLLLSASLGHVWGYSYLLISPTAAKSHFYVGQALAKGLVAAGHEVTVISPFPQKKPIKNYVDVATPNIITAMAGKYQWVLQWESHVTVISYSPSDNNRRAKRNPGSFFHNQ